MTRRLKEKRFKWLNDLVPSRWLFLLSLAALVALIPKISVADFPFCRRITIVYFAPPKSVFERWAVQFREALIARIAVRDPIEVISSLRIGMRSPEAGSAVAKGILDVVVVPWSVLIGSVPTVSVVNAPGFVTRHKHELVLQTGRFFDIVRAEAGKRGIQVLGMGWMSTFLASATTEVTSLTNLEGKKIRAVSAGDEILITALGGRPVRMRSRAVARSFQRRAIDSAIVLSNPAAALAERGMVKSAIEFSSNDGFRKYPFVMIMNKDLFARSAVRAQRAIMEAGVAAGRSFLQFQREHFVSTKGRLKAAGVKIVELNASERAKFQRVVKSKVLPHFLKTDVDKALVNERQKLFR